MPVDREARDKMADAAASFMRGEIKAAEYENTLMDVWPSENGPEDRPDDTEVKTLAYELMHFYYTNLDHICLSRERWQAFRRWIAFLKTDYGLIAKKLPRSLWLFAVPFAFLLLFIAVILLTWYTWFWPILICGWLTLGIIYTALEPAQWKALRQVADTSGGFDPFLSEKDWNEHKYLLEPFVLPEYDEQIHYKSVRGQWREVCQRWTFGPLFFQAGALLCMIQHRKVYLRTEDPVE